VIQQAGQTKEIVVGFDLDGVILDYTSLKLRVALEYGWKLKAEQTPSDILKRIVPRSVWDEIQEILYVDSVVARSVPLMEGALQGISCVQHQKLSYFLISRRKVPERAIDSLKIHSLWPKYFDEKNTFFVDAPEDKNKKAEVLGITHYVDDEISVLEQLNSVPNKILFDPLNVFVHITAYPRASCWDDLVASLSLS